MQNTWLGSKTCPTIKQTTRGKESSVCFQYFSFSIFKKTNGKETSAIAWLVINLIGFYCARLVYFARVL